MEFNLVCVVVVSTFQHARLCPDLTASESILNSMEDEDDASVTVSRSDTGVSSLKTQHRTVAPGDLEGLAAAFSGSRKALRFDVNQPAGGGADGQLLLPMPLAGHDEGTPARRSSKVAPAATPEPENRSQSSAGLSKATASGLHRTIEAGLHIEDTILILLRRLLVLLSFIVIGLSLATTIISKGVISQGVSAATLATKKGDLPIIQQVSDSEFLLWLSLCLS